MDIVPAFIPHAQAPLLVDPRVSEAGSDAASAQALAVLARRVRLVRVHFAGTMPGATPWLFHVGHRLQQGEQLAGVVDVGSRQTLGQGPRPFLSTRR